MSLTDQSIDQIPSIQVDSILDEFPPQILGSDLGSLVNSPVAGDLLDFAGGVPGLDNLLSGDIEGLALDAAATSLLGPFGPLVADQLKSQGIIPDSPVGDVLGQAKDLINPSQIQPPENPLSQITDAPQLNMTLAVGPGSGVTRDAGRLDGQMPPKGPTLFKLRESSIGMAPNPLGFETSPTEALTGLASSGLMSQSSSLPGMSVPSNFGGGSLPAKFQGMTGSSIKNLKKNPKSIASSVSRHYKSALSKVLDWLRNLKPDEELEEFAQPSEFGYKSDFPEIPAGIGI